MERSIDVRTGESIAIRYELAGLGSRFLAVLVDLVAQVALAIALLFVASLWAETAGRSLARSANAGAWSLALMVIALFTIFIGWFIIFETWWSGRTPGKRALGLRVVRDGGFPLDSGAAVIRNLVRLLEFGLGFYAISAVSALLSKENKRLGDIAAGTIVVRDRADPMPDLDAYLSRASRTDTGLAEDDRVLAERFLARRETLEPAARLRLAAQIAERIRPTLRAAYANLDDESLLEFLTGG